jgi:hypothetical protein
MFETSDAVGALMRAAGNVTGAAQLLGVEPAELRAAMANPVLLHAQLEAVEINLDLAESKVLAAIANNDAAAARDYLRAHGRHRGYGGQHPEPEALEPLNDEFAEAERLLLPQRQSGRGGG